MKEFNSVEICAGLREALLDDVGAMQVHSVFESAVNITGGDIFYSFLDHRRFLFPMSCKISIDIPFTKSGICEGMEVTSSGETIFIPKADLFINLKHSKERDLSFHRNEGLLVPKDLELRVLILKELIEDKGCEYDLSTLVTRKYKNPYADIVKKKLTGLNIAIKEGSTQAATKAGGLAGCGIGLTPSSDDMLIGYMSAYLADSKAKGYGWEEAYNITSAMGNEAAKHTNTISGAFLSQCGNGLLSEDMRSLMCALYSDSNVDLVRKCGQRIQNFGSTSGTDMLTGIVLAIVNLNGYELVA